MIVATLRASLDGTRRVAWPDMQISNRTRGCTTLLLMELTRGQAAGGTNPGGGTADSADVETSSREAGDTTGDRTGDTTDGSRLTSSGYPINWLRNAGIACVATSHYLLLDIDFWPSHELLPLLRRQLADQTWEERTALVVPNFQRTGHGCRTSDDASACRSAFESGAIRMPSTFSELDACLASHDCGVFDGEYNPAGQSSTDIQAWRQLLPGAVRRVPCIASQRYEPYVALRKAVGAPEFDERFQGYGKNKVQWLVHLRYSGYSFAVLGRGFLVHFPHPRSSAKFKWLHTSAHGRVDRLFTEFVHGLATRYKDVPPQTPLCSDARGRSRNATATGGHQGAESVAATWEGASITIPRRNEEAGEEEEQAEHHMGERRLSVAERRTAVSMLNVGAA